MKLTILGATGGIGRHLVDRALRAGHDVTAVVRRPDALAPGATAVVTDLAAPDRAALEQSANAADAVLSVLGPRSRREVGIATVATRAVVDAMAVTGTRRLVVISAAPVGGVASPARPHPPRHDPGDDPLARYVLMPLIRRVFARNYVDLATMEDVVRGSDLDWTVVRPPRLTAADGTGVYRTALDQNVRRGRLIARADVADLMLTLVDRDETIRHSVGVAY